MRKIATKAGTDAERLVKEAALRLLHEDARFRTAVKEGIAQADRGEFIEEKEMDDWNRCCVPKNGYPLDSRRRSGLAALNEYLGECHPHYRQPTCGKPYEAVGSLKESPLGETRQFLPSIVSLWRALKSADASTPYRTELSCSNTLYRPIPIRLVVFNQLSGTF